MQTTGNFHCGEYNRTAEPKNRITQNDDYNRRRGLSDHPALPGQWRGRNG